MLNLTKAFVGNTELMECYIGENNDKVALQLVTDMGAAQARQIALNAAAPANGHGIRRARCAFAWIVRGPGKSS